VAVLRGRERGGVGEGKKVEDRRQKTEDRRQKTEARSKKQEARSKKREARSEKREEGPPAQRVLFWLLTIE
jgi:hypothetical protein